MDFFHSMFMNIGLIFKFVYENYGDMKIAADIANKVLYYNMISTIVIFYIM